jgi:hypothetical protein
MGHDVPSWRLPRGRALPVRAVLAILVGIGALLLEVWQTASVRSLSLEVAEATRQMQLASAELEWARAERAQGLDRAGVAPVAADLGLRPTDPRQFVALPAEYLVHPESIASPAPGLLAAAGRAVSSLVPEAMARSVRVN